MQVAAVTCLYMERRVFAKLWIDRNIQPMKILESLRLEQTQYFAGSTAKVQQRTRTIPASNAEPGELSGMLGPPALNQALVAIGLLPSIRLFAEFFGGHGQTRS